MADYSLNQPSGARSPAPGGRWQRALRGEFRDVHPRLTIASALAAALPPLAFHWTRTQLFRLGGVSIGPRSRLKGRLRLIGPGDIGSRLVIGSDCWLNGQIFVDLTGQVTIGDRVNIAHHVVIITAEHAIGGSERRAGLVHPEPVVIGDGAWLGARVTVLPGAVIGAGAIIGAGSLVRGEIPADTVAVGSPARVIRKLDGRNIPPAPP